MGLLPLAATASLVLMLSSLSLQVSALQTRSQVSTGQRLRQVEDQLMSAAQHLAAAAGAVEQLPDRVGLDARVGAVAYRLVQVTGPTWPAPAEAGALQQGRAELTVELLPSAAQPRAQRAAFALELVRPPAPADGPVQLRALRELGLRGRGAAEVAS